MVLLDSVLARLFRFVGRQVLFLCSHPLYGMDYLGMFFQWIYSFLSLYSVILPCVIIVFLFILSGDFVSFFPIMFSIIQFSSSLLYVIYILFFIYLKVCFHFFFLVFFFLLCAFLYFSRPGIFYQIFFLSPVIVSFLSFCLLSFFYFLFFLFVQQLVYLLLILFSIVLVIFSLFFYYIALFLLL